MQKFIEYYHSLVVCANVTSHRRDVCLGHVCAGIERKIFDLQQKLVSHIVNINVCPSQVQALLNRYYDSTIWREALLLEYIPRDCHRKSSSPGNITTPPKISNKTHEIDLRWKIGFPFFFSYDYTRFTFRVSIFLYLAIVLLQFTRIQINLLWLHFT